MKDIKIREASTADAESILSLVKDLAVQHNALSMIVYTARDLVEAGIGTPSAPVGAVVAENAGGEVVGVALYFYRFSTWKGPTVHIEDLIVSGECRGMGVGEALMDEVVSMARKRGVDRIELDVEADNENAIRFYEKKGYCVKEWYAAKLYLNDKIKE